MATHTSAFEAILQDRGVLGALMDMHARLSAMEQAIQEMAERLSPSPKPEKVEEEENG